MKKFIQIVTAAVLSVGFVGTVASAASCNGVIVVNSGNNNTVTVDCKDISTVTINCNNGVYEANINYQQGQSGNAQVGSGSGTATSGNVTNSNNTTKLRRIDNNHANTNAKHECDTNAKRQAKGTTKPCYE